jgi:O-antigen/teichoic acid export membrane protein
MKNDNLLDSSLKLLVKSSFIVLISMLFAKIIGGYLYKIIIAKYYGLEAYGMFSLAFMLISIFISFSSLGLTEGILRLVPIYKEKKEYDKINYLFKFTIITLGIIGFFSAFILFIFSDIISISVFHNPLLSNYIKIFSLSIFISIILSILLSVLRAYEEIKWYSILYNISTNLLKVSLIILFIFLGVTKVISISLSYVLAVALTLIFAFFVCKKKCSQVFISSNLKKQEKKDILKQLFSYSLPLLFFGFVSSILSWIDTFFIGYYKGVSQVGLYNAALPLVLLLNFAPEIFMQLFFPLINREYSKKNIILIRELSKQVGKWVFILNLPLVILLLVFPGAFINIIFGNEFLPAIDALRILSIGFFIGSISIISYNLIAMTGKSKLLLYNMAFASLLNFILNLFLVPINKIWIFDNSTGIVGAALSTTISLIIYSLLLILESKYLISIVPFKRSLLKISMISLIPLTLLLMIRHYFENPSIYFLMLLGVLFFLIYFILILVSNSFDKKDMMIINSIIKKISKKELSFFK